MDSDDHRQRIFIIPAAFDHLMYSTLRHDYEFSLQIF